MSLLLSGFLAHYDRKRSVGHLLKRIAGELHDVSFGAGFHILTLDFRCTVFQGAKISRNNATERHVTALFPATYVLAA